MIIRSTYVGYSCYNITEAAAGPQPIADRPHASSLKIAPVCSKQDACLRGVSPGGAFQGLVKVRSLCDLGYKS